MNRRRSIALLGALLLAGAAEAETRMPAMTDETEQGVEQAFAAFADAMQAGDTDTLRGLTDAGFTLTHITGFIQPGHEWLAEMREGQFVYYRIDTRDIRVTVSGTTARLVARTLTDARVYGGRNDWRLQLALDYTRRDGRWIATRAVATIWR
jgi:ketosteroid isomerase-like protein